MSKKKKKTRETTIEDYYDLRTDKIDELVAALKGETPEDAEPVSYNMADCMTPESATQGEVREYSKKQYKEFNPYKLDRLSRVPTWIKAIVIKWWFAGMVCYICSILLGYWIGMGENQIWFNGLVLGLVVELLVNPVMRYFADEGTAFNPYIMFPFPFKKYWTFLTNVVYYIVVVWITYFAFYYVINIYIGNLVVEPVLFATFITVVDMIFIGLKDLGVHLVKKFKHNKAEVKNDV